MSISRALLLASLSIVGACKPDGGSTPPPSPPPALPPSPPPALVTIPFSFTSAAAGWKAGHADYGLGQEPMIGFSFGFEPVTVDLQIVPGMYTSAYNRSDDEFMYIYHQAVGLAPNTNYKVDITISFATNAPPGCIGVGGAPGEGVTIKAGATSAEPATVIDSANSVRVNFDKGNQEVGGANLAAIGSFAQETSGDCSGSTYKRKTLSTGSRSVVVRSDVAGQLWLVIGTDSGFEASTKIYYLAGQAILTPT